MAAAAPIDELAQKHRALELRIEQEMSRPSADPLKLAALKREKLKIKDTIAKLSGETRH